MLTRVLMHVIEAPLPVDDAGDFGLSQRGAQNGRNPAIVVIHHLAHRHTAERAGVERLPARSGIERCPVQVDAPVVRARIDDASPEFSQITVAVGKAIRHWIDNWTVLLARLPTTT